MRSATGTVGDDTVNDQYSRPIKALCVVESPSEADAEAVAIRLTTQVIAARPLETAVWELWEAIIDDVPTDSWNTCLSLLDAIREQPPATPPGPKTAHAQELLIDGRLHWASLPGFGLPWREEHDTLHNQRFQGSTGVERYVNFVKFSAAWRGRTQGKIGVDAVLVFLLSRDVLEMNRPKGPDSGSFCRLSTEHSWALDVRLAAIWIRDGGLALWTLDSGSERVQHYWGRALAIQTDLWPRSDGLTRERWALWSSRLQVLSVEEELDEETRGIVSQAAKVVGDLLKET